MTEPLTLPAGWTIAPGEAKITRPGGYAPRCGYDLVTAVEALDATGGTMPAGLAVTLEGFGRMMHGYIPADVIRAAFAQAGVPL